MATPPVNPVQISRTRLDDDGIVDPIAVEIAAKGTRPVELTDTEQTAAAVLMLKRGASPSLVAYRLRMATSTARRIAAAIQLAASIHDDTATFPAVA